MKWIEKKFKPDFQVIMETYRDLIWDKVKKYSHLIDNPEKTNGIKGPSDPEDKFIGLEYLDWYLKTLPGKGGPQYSRALTASMIWKYDNEFQERIIEIDNLVRQKLGGMDIWFNGAGQYYPPGGYMSWHDNRNAPGYNILITWSEKGDGFFRYYDMDKNTIETMLDRPGWTAKVGYYGGVSDTCVDVENVVPHCCKNYDHRFTFGWYTPMVKEFQDDMINEIFE